MGSLRWEISKPEGLVLVRGVGVFNLSFIISFREALRAEGAAGYSKLFDLSRADIHLNGDDLQTMAARTRLADPLRSGPIAIFLGQEPPPLLVDMAVLLKTRIGNRRRLRLFTNEMMARHWLSTEAEQINSEPARQLVALR
jgi:hypothetical protein